MNDLEALVRLRRDSPLLPADVLQRLRDREVHVLGRERRGGVDLAELVVDHAGELVTYVGVYTRPELVEATLVAFPALRGHDVLAVLGSAVVDLTPPGVHLTLNPYTDTELVLT